VPVLELLGVGEALAGAGVAVALLVGVELGLSEGGGEDEGEGEGGGAKEGLGEGADVTGQAWGSTSAAAKGHCTLRIRKVRSET
jgi:hypothetical protein